jgi:hypothetical protein
MISGEIKGTLTGGFGSEEKNAKGRTRTKATATLINERVRKDLDFGIFAVEMPLGRVVAFKAA